MAVNVTIYILGLTNLDQTNDFLLTILFIKIV
jgi:hypothetical protein